MSLICTLYIGQYPNLLSCVCGVTSKNVNKWILWSPDWCSRSCWCFGLSHYALVYLSSTALTTDHQGLVHWLELTLNVPVGFFCHNKDMRFELLLIRTHRLIKMLIIQDYRQSRQCLAHFPEINELDVEAAPDKRRQRRKEVQYCYVWSGLKSVNDS